MSTEDYVRNVVAAAPPFNPSQRDQLATLLKTGASAE